MAVQVDNTVCFFDQVTGLEYLAEKSSLGFAPLRWSARALVMLALSKLSFSLFNSPIKKYSNFFPYEASNDKKVIFTVGMVLLFTAVSIRMQSQTSSQVARIAIAVLNDTFCIIVLSPLFNFNRENLTKIRKAHLRLLSEVACLSLSACFGIDNCYWPAVQMTADLAACKLCCNKPLLIEA